jgi:hypothetical protein
MPRHAEPVYRFAFEIELDQHGGLVPDHPPLVPWFDRDELRGLVLDDAPVGKPDVDLTLIHEADMGVHAQIGPDDGLQVGVPIESGRVDHALHSHVPGLSDIDLNAADVVALVGFHRGEKWIGRAHGGFLPAYSE